MAQFEDPHEWKTHENLKRELDQTFGRIEPSTGELVPMTGPRRGDRLDPWDAAKVGTSTIAMVEDAIADGTPWRASRQADEAVYTLLEHGYDIAAEHLMRFLHDRLWREW
jgi:hypothetical protein